MPIARQRDCDSRSAVATAEETKDPVEAATAATSDALWEWGSLLAVLNFERQDRPLHTCSLGRMLSLPYERTGGSLVQSYAPESTIIPCYFPPQEWRG